MHPYLAEGIVESFQAQSNEYRSEFNSFSAKVEEEISKRENEINLLLKEDIVLNFIEATFNVGNEYDIDTVFDIVKESNFRFPNKIAPGWEDQDDKDGIQRVADLIIWKQIIDFSKEKNKPIILIINDVKDDWCHSKKRSNEKRIIRPRKELIQEIRDKASTNFWMYTFNDFLYKSKDYLETNIKPETLDEVKRLSQVRSYFILNTNLSNSEIDHQSMMDEQIAAAYFGHWKNKIFKIDSGDIVFLYKSGTGITAMGVSDGVVQTRDYQGKSEYKDEEHYVTLDNFCNLECDPITASEVKEITGTNHRFMTVMFKIDGSEGSRLLNEAEQRRCTEST